MYYELRMKIMNTKQAKIDRNVICLENDTLKRMNKIRGESEKRLEKLDSVFQNNDAINDENFLYLWERNKDIWRAIEEVHTALEAINRILDNKVDKQ